MSVHEIATQRYANDLEFATATLLAACGVGNKLVIKANLAVLEALVSGGVSDPEGSFDEIHETYQHALAAIRVSQRILYLLPAQDGCSR